MAKILGKEVRAIETQKSDERVEVFELATRGIRVAEYLTALPPKKLLEQKLHQAVLHAQQRLPAAD